MLPDALADGSFAFGPLAVIEFRHEPVLHACWQGDVTESSIGVFLDLVLFYGSIHRNEAPASFLWQRFAYGLPIVLPFPVPVQGSIRL